MLKILFPFSLLLIILSASGSFSCANQNPPDPKPKVILDADLDSDVDDVGALAMLINLHKAGVIDLIGVIVTSDDPYAPVCADALNRYYGLENIPVGFLMDQPGLTNHSRYTRFIAEEYPARLKTWQDAEEAVALYRRLLVQSPDESVFIVSIGHLTSLQGLLQSSPDQLSPLGGLDLANLKVKQWICMGGQYPSGKEANFYRPDPASTVYCVNHWQKDVIFCGWEIGNLVITGGTWLKENLNPSHPVYRSYELYNGFAGRQSWDQIAVLKLIRECDPFFNYVTGECIVNEDGSNTWENRENGPHRYVVFDPSANVEKITLYTDMLMAGKAVLPEGF